MLKIGQSVIRTPVTIGDPNRVKGEPKCGPMKGTVVYIHPKGRYHTVEFIFPMGTLKESFSGVVEWAGD